MVSMQPYSERYDFSFKYMPSLCSSQKKKPVYINPTTIYGILKNNPTFSKIVKLIERGNLSEYLTKEFYENGYTLFVVEDKNMPDSFVNTMDLFTSRQFINSYLINGIADKKYLIANGSSVYSPFTRENPILAVVTERNNIYINKVGKLMYSIPASNGIIHVLDNIAQIDYRT